MATRKYEQRLRAEHSEETRRRILDAVAQLVRGSPTEPISLDAVAHEAKVARSTIYLIFGSRAGLFDAFAEDLMVRSGMAELTEAVAHPDAREHLRGGMRAGMHMMAKEPDLFRVLYSMARLDPDAVGAAIRKRESGRTGGMRHLARRLAEDGVLRDDVSVKQAADMLWVLTSFEAFDLLHAGRGLSVDKTIATLTAMAERAVCREVSPASPVKARTRR
jgi:AcrR family transcriptional regulator